MATLEQLKEGILRAHAAGNFDDAQALADIYKQQAHEAKTGIGAAFKHGLTEGKASAEQGIATLLGAAGMKNYSQDWLSSSEAARKEAAGMYEGTTEEDVARARAENGPIAELLAKGKKNIAEPLGGMVGRFGPTMAMSAAGPWGLGAAGLNEYLASVGEVKHRGGDDTTSMLAAAPLAALNVAKIPTGRLGTYASEAVAKGLGRVTPEAAEAGVREAALAAQEAKAAEVAGLAGRGDIGPLNPIENLAVQEAKAAPFQAAQEAAIQAAKEVPGQRTWGGFAGDVAAGAVGNAAVNIPLSLASEALTRHATGEKPMSAEEAGELSQQLALLSPIFGAGHAVLHNPVRDAKLKAESAAAEVGVSPEALEAQQLVDAAKEAKDQYDIDNTPFHPEHSADKLWNTLRETTGRDDVPVYSDLSDQQRKTFNDAIKAKGDATRESKDQPGVYEPKKNTVTAFDRVAGKPEEILGTEAVVAPEAVKPEAVVAPEAVGAPEVVTEPTVRKKSVAAIKPAEKRQRIAEVSSQLFEQYYPGEKFDVLPDNVKSSWSGHVNSKWKTPESFTVPTTVRKYFEANTPEKAYQEAIGKLKVEPVSIEELKNTPPDKYGNTIWDSISQIHTPGKPLNINKVTQNVNAYHEIKANAEREAERQRVLAKQAADLEAVKQANLAQQEKDYNTIVEASREDTGNIREVFDKGLTSQFTNNQINKHILSGEQIAERNTAEKARKAAASVEKPTNTYSDIRDTASGIRKVLDESFSLPEYLNNNRVTTAGIEGVNASNTKETLLNYYAASHTADAKINEITKGRDFFALSDADKAKVRAIQEELKPYTAEYNNAVKSYGDNDWFKTLDAKTKAATDKYKPENLKRAKLVEKPAAPEIKSTEIEPVQAVAPEIKPANRLDNLTEDQLDELVFDGKISQRAADIELDRRKQEGKPKHVEERVDTSEGEPIDPELYGVTEDIDPIVAAAHERAKAAINEHNETDTPTQELSDKAIAAVLERDEAIAEVERIKHEKAEARKAEREAKKLAKQKAAQAEREEKARVKEEERKAVLAEKARLKDEAAAKKADAAREEATKKADEQARKAEYDAAIAHVAKELNMPEDRVVFYDPETRHGLYTHSDPRWSGVSYRPFHITSSGTVLNSATSRAQQYLKDSIAQLRKESFAAGDIQMKELFGTNQISVKLSDPTLTNIVSEWAVQLGLDRLPNGKRVLITDKDWAQKTKLKGSLEQLPHFDFSTGGYGVHIPLPDINGERTGDHAITIDTSLTPHEQLETLAHEMGHTVEQVYLSNAPKETQSAIKADFNRYLEAHGKAATSHDIAKLFEPPEAAKRTYSMPEVSRDNLTTRSLEYSKLFGEWFANQTAKWATSAEQPRSVVDKFFAALGKILRDFFNVNKEYLPEKSVAEFLNSLKDRASEYAAAYEGVESGEVQHSRSLHANDPLIKRAVGSGYTTMKEIEAPKSIPDRVKGMNSWMNSFWQSIVNEWHGVETTLAPHLGKMVGEKQRADLIGRFMSTAPNFITNALQMGGIEVLKDGTMDITKIPVRLSSGKVVNASIYEMQRQVDKIGKEGRDLFNHVAYVLDAADQLKRDPGKVGKHITDNMAEFRQHEKDVAALRAKYPELNDALDMWRGINKSLIKSAFDSGLINKKTRDAFMKNTSYSPRYMLREEVLQRLGVQEVKPTEVGNTSTKVFRERTAAEHQVNVWENMTRHYAGMTLGIMANETKKAIGEQFVAVNAAKEVERSTRKSEQGNLAVMVNGERKFYKVDSPELIPSMMQVQQDFGPLMKAARGATQVLRTGALSNPGYWIRQIARDPIAATLATDLGWITPAHTMKELTSIMQGNNPAYELLARRGVIGHVDPSLNASDVHHFMDTMSRRVNPKGAIASVADTGANFLNKMHIAVDGATRVAIYKEALLKAAKEGLHGKAAENYAVMMARENINFSVTGESQAIKQARLLIPFLSAGINGLELMRKAMTASNIPMKERAEFRRQFLGKVATIGMLSAAYTMYMSGNEEYESLPDNRRYNNWVFPSGIKDHPVAIALPPEFAFVKWLPEMMVRYGMGTQNAQQVMTAAAKQVQGMMPGGMGYTLLPIPQIARPAVEAWMNKSTYTGEDIETKGEHYQLESDRASVLANTLSQLGMSAPKWDHLFRGYGAELGSAVLAITDMMLKPENGPVKPDKDFVELPGLGLKSTFGAKYASQQRTDFYTHKDEVDSLRSRLNTLKEQGRADEFNTLLNAPDTKAKFQMAQIYDKIGRQMQQLGKEIKIIEANKNITDEMRDTQVDRRKRDINRLAAEAEKIWQKNM
jgi:hypothetical protein